jgi:hypothetical protein
MTEGACDYLEWSINQETKSVSISHASPNAAVQFPAAIRRDQQVDSIVYSGVMDYQVDWQTDAQDV